MIEEFIEYLSPYIGTFTQIILYGLAAAIGVAIIICLVRLAVNVCYTVEDCALKIKKFTASHKDGFRAKWIGRFNRMASKIGTAVVDALKESNYQLSVDHRPDMLGKWVSNRGDYMTIEDHKGYYTVTFEGIKTPNDPDFGSFMLRDLQGWLHDHNVYSAEGYKVLTLAITDEVDEIFIAELNRTYHRFDPFSVMDPFEVITEAVKEEKVEYFREDHVDHSYTGPKVMKISDEDMDKAFNDSCPGEYEPITISPEVKERIKSIMSDDSDDDTDDLTLKVFKK